MKNGKSKTSAKAIIDPLRKIVAVSKDIDSAWFDVAGDYLGDSGRLEYSNKGYRVISVWVIEK